MTALFINQQKKYIEAFENSAAYIFKSEIGIELKKSSVSIKNTQVPALPICVCIGFVDNNVSGQVIYSTTLDFTEKVAKLMMPTKSQIEQKKYLYSCIAELSNMISGRATMYIGSLDHVMQITPPLVFKLENQSATNTSGEKILLDFLSNTSIGLLLDSILGCLEINISFKQN